jgi:hypothetical protein
MFFYLTLGLTLVYLFTWFYMNGTSKKGEPVLFRGQLPFFGNILEIGRLGLYEFVKRNSEKYGKIFTIILLEKEHISLLTTKSILEFKKNQNYFLSILLSMRWVKNLVEKSLNLILP